MQNSIIVNTNGHDEEIPILILILKNSGISIFSWKFNTDKLINDQLIGGLLMAINAFGNEVFKASGSIDQIIYQDYTIMMREVESFTFCYIFKGRKSFQALIRLEKFIYCIKEIYWELLVEATSKNITLDITELTGIMTYISEIFHS